MTWKLTESILKKTEGKKEEGKTLWFKYNVLPIWRQTAFQSFPSGEKFLCFCRHCRIFVGIFAELFYGVKIETKKFLNYLYQHVSSVCVEKVFTTTFNFLFHSSSEFFVAGFVPRFEDEFGKFVGIIVLVVVFFHSKSNFYSLRGV